MVEKRTPRIFLIKHKRTKRQQREFDRLSVPLRYLPENLAGFTVNCPFCKTVFRPDWFEKQKLPIVPVKPKFETKGIGYTGPARWIMKQVSQKCPKCGASVMIDLPINKMKAKGYLFGDDAERSYGNKKVFIYSLVGTDQSLLPEFENKIKMIKQGLFPSIPPDSWKIHMKYMWAGSSREKHPIYRALSFGDVINFVDKLLLLIKKSNLFIYNIASVVVQNDTANRKVQSLLKNEAYILLILNVIDEWTTKNAQPNIFFDSEKDSKANKIIHSWARDTFRGSQYSLLYGFLSKGIEVPEPKFVPPASRPGLEVADFVSFTIARYYLRMWQGKEIEIDPKDMGLVTYLGYDSNGDLLWKRQEGYPWDQFCH